MTYRTYDFTAFSEASLLAQGGNGSSIGCGDTFIMPTSADTCISVTDNDCFLSGDSKCNENADDRYGQKASIETDGASAGNGGQIYAEVYYWVHDQHGNWYVMIEIEQEGTHDDFFTFYTGHGYEMPPAGAELTVKSACNVTSDWIKFDDLGAGDKDDAATGTISGTVFCDTDCDGVNGELKLVPGASYTIEAEDMHSKGFDTVHGAHASGGELVKLDCAGGSGKLYTDFKGADGTYDLTIRVQDESDGQSKIKLYVDGAYIDAVRLDQDTDGKGSNNGGFSTYVIKDVHISHGDEIELVVRGDGGEYVRIDKIDIDGEDTSIYEPEPVKAGVTIKLLDLDGNVIETTVTDHDGNYAFQDVPVGEYKIMGVAPDGTEFTIKDAGSDDTLDSDVDGSGTSGVITVTDGDTVDVDLGVCETKEGVVTGTVFHDIGCDGIGGTSDFFPAWAQDISNVVVYFDRDGDGTIDFSVKIDDFPDGGESKFISNDLDDFFTQAVDYIVSQIGALSPGTTVVGASIKGGTQTTQFYAVDGSGSNDGPTLNTGPGNNAVLQYGDFFASYVPGEGGGGTISEPTKEGVTIRLLSAVDGTLIAETTTDADGTYRFENVPVGDYTIQGVAPDGTKFTIKDAGSDDSVDSDVDATGTSDVFTVSDGGETDIDLGVCEIQVEDDAGKGCADELITVDLSDNYKAGVATITALDGVAILDGETKLISGVNVTRDGDTFIFDGEDAYAALDIGEQDSQTFTFTVEEGGGVAQASIDVTFCGDANSYESLLNSFPASGSYQVVSADQINPIGEFAFTIRVDGTGDSRLDGQVFENAYCLSFFDPAAVGSTFGSAPINTGDIFGSEGASALSVFDPGQISAANGLAASENIDLVSYIVSKNYEGTGTYTGREVQFAIWELTDGIEADVFAGFLPGLDGSDVDAIVADAIANGEGFEFGAEGHVGAIIDPNPVLAGNAQPFIVGFEFDAYDCLC